MRGALLIVVAAAASAVAAAPVQAPLAATAIDAALVLPPPPAEGSARALEEIGELHRMQVSRTSAEMELAASIGKIKDLSVFNEAIGGVDLRQFPATMALFASLRAEEKRDVDVAKDVFKRKRPWIVDPTITSCSVSEDPLSSYPSGHTSMAYSMAAVLARLVPQHAPAIMARAAEYGQTRIICEQHFRSDVSAGQAFGMIIAERLMANPGFVRQFALAKAELAKAVR